MGNFVYQIDIDGRLGDIRPTYSSTMARLSAMTSDYPRHRADAKALAHAFPGDEVGAFCRPECFLHRAIASLGPGQKRIAVHDLTVDISGNTLVEWIPCLTEFDPTYIMLFGMHLARAGLETRRRASAYAGREVRFAVAAARRSGKPDAHTVQHLRTVQIRTGGIVFVPDGLVDHTEFLDGLGSAVEGRFTDIADAIGL